MNRPITEYFFSSENGDVPVGEEMLSRPFVVRPMEPHPFLTLGDFFNAVREFIWHEKGKTLTDILDQYSKQKIKTEDIEKLIIRYEKYGALYQIASVEGLNEKQIAKFSVSTALLDEAKAFAGKFKSLPGFSIEMGKAVIENGLNMSLKEALELERMAFSMLYSTEDQKEGLKAFLEKRAPKFKGK